MKTTNRRLNALGFTLIELMIVVGIIGILAAIAIPNFLTYQLRSRQAEALTYMGNIKVDQESFKASYDSYANISAPEPVGPPTPAKRTWVKTVCPATCNRTAPANCTTFDCIGFESGGQTYFRYSSLGDSGLLVSPPEFCIAAVGDLDGDTVFGQFEYQSSNAPGTNVGMKDCPDAAACALGIIPGSVMDCNPSSF